MTRLEGEDIGGGHRIAFYTRDDDTRVGLIDWHQSPDKMSDCSGGSVLFDLPANADFDTPKWQVVSMDPLTLSPSLLCTICGDHGWIRDGRWVIA